MAGKKKPSAVPPPPDDNVYRVKHISRSAWEEGTLNLPGLTPKAAREENEFDDVAMDMAMTGEIPLELIREMLRQEEERAQARKKPQTRDTVSGMISPEEIVPARAEAAEEAPTPAEIAAAKDKMRAMRAKSRLPETQEEPKKAEELKKPELAKSEKKMKKMKKEKALEDKPAPEPAPEPVFISAPEPEPAPEPERTSALPPRTGDAPGFLDDGAPLYSIPLGGILRTLYRSLYYYGLRFVRPLRIFGNFMLPHLATPLLTLWYFLRAGWLTLGHLTLGRARRAFLAGREAHAKRLAVRKGRVKLRTALHGLLVDYRPVLRPALNAAMPIAALAVLLVVMQAVSNFTYALQINYYGIDLGNIANENVFLQAQAAANRHIDPLPEAAGEDRGITEADRADQSNVQFKIVQVPPEQLTSVGTLTDQLLENYHQEMTSACGIRINGQLFATIKNSTDADSVLASIKNEKSAGLPKDENASIGFVQTVELVQGFYPAAQLVDAKTLLGMLTRPRSEQIIVALAAGDTISGLQTRYGVSSDELYALNPDLKGNETKLQPGDTLVMKAEVSTLEVKIVQTEVRLEDVPFDTVDSDNNNMYKGEIRVRVKGEPGQDRVTERVTYINQVPVGQAEEISRKRVKEPTTERRDIGRKSTTIQQPDGTKIVINPSASGFTWPVPACTRVSSPYGYRGRSFHRGIDIADGNTNGKIIVAAKDGVVELVQLGGSSYGNMILINHGNGVKTRYAHMMSGSISVRQGEHVNIGQPIGRVGSTGNSTGPHLHFEVIINGGTQNPLNYVKR